VPLPLLAAFKIQLYRELRAANITRTELPGGSGGVGGQIDDLFRLDHTSPVDQIEAAFRALNRDIIIEVETAA
jgi:hypothetical protein